MSLTQRIEVFPTYTTGYETRKNMDDSSVLVPTHDFSLIIDSCVIKLTHRFLKTFFMIPITNLEKN